MFGEEINNLWNAACDARNEQVPRNRDTTAIETKQGLVKFMALEQCETNNVTTFECTVNKILVRCRSRQTSTENSRVQESKDMCWNIQNLGQVLCDVERAGATISGKSVQILQPTAQSCGFLV